MVGIVTILLETAFSMLQKGAMSPVPFLSGSATYSGKTIATLGVTPGTYVWTWGTGANQNFALQIPVPPPPPVTGPPVAITNPATLIASFSANTERLGESARIDHQRVFSIWNNERYGLTTAPQSQSGNTFLNISANISGLTASTTYHFRIVTADRAGTRYGSDKTFTTLPPTGFPIVTTKPATNVAAFCGDTHWFTRSARVDHERLFPMWHHRPITGAPRLCRVTLETPSQI